MAFPNYSHTVLDEFDGSTSMNAPRTGWSSAPFNAYRDDATPSGGQIGPSGTGYGSWWWNLSTFGPDVEVIMEIPTTTGGNFWIGARIKEPSASVSTVDGYIYNAYFIGGGSGLNSSMYRADNTALTALGSVHAVNGRDAVGLSCVGSAIKCFTRSAGVWTERSSATDSTYTEAGFVMFLMGASMLPRIERISVGVPSKAPPPPRRMPRGSEIMRFMLAGGVPLDAKPILLGG